ncbi:crotonase/enoyl-CoA hydratase family protein [uncultured Endozoicomonas sp.]|uniref:crotonase/enoyl-CoA hydratase family protein n=1 Tax=uncultured Endozoicomonas sp. TaxID=432652 RepID=UPI002606E4E8|nr:crotonase/enoyl-CoA hydratase family protein [uncultured Endozoicomonas sp.]
MNYTTLRVEREGPVTQVILNRPDKRNAMNREFWLEFPKAIRAIDEEGSTRVIVISGEGKMFSAGMDLTVFMSPNQKMISGDQGRKSENLRRTVLQLQECFNVLEEVRMPVLAAVHGGCIGGAINLVSACDCRYATEDAYFSIKETELGMTADLGVLQRLGKLMPEGLVRELAYTARKLPADEALRTGLVNAVFADQDSLMAHVMDIARQISSNSPLAVMGSKEVINFSRDHSVSDSLRYMAAWQSGMFQPGEMMVGFQAKMQKSEPEYQDLWPVEEPFS